MWPTSPDCMSEICTCCAGSEGEYNSRASPTSPCIPLSPHPYQTHINGGTLLLQGQLAAMHPPGTPQALALHNMTSIPQDEPLNLVSHFLTIFVVIP